MLDWRLGKSFVPGTRASSSRQIMPIRAVSRPSYKRQVKYRQLGFGGMRMMAEVADTKPHCFSAYNRQGIAFISASKTSRPL